MTQKILKLTCMVKKEGNQYSSLCLELDVASCGKTKEEAIDGLKGAVETYVNYLVDEGRESQMYRPVPQDAIREFILSGAERSKLTTVYAVPLEFSYAA